jgi:hypothetical protein
VVPARRSEQGQRDGLNIQNLHPLRERNVNLRSKSERAAIFSAVEVKKISEDRDGKMRRNWTANMQAARNGGIRMGDGSDRG